MMNSGFQILGLMFAFMMIVLFYRHSIESILKTPKESLLLAIPIVFLGTLFTSFLNLKAFKKKTRNFFLIGIELNCRCKFNIILILIERVNMDLKALKSRHQELEGIIQTSYQNYVPDLRVRRYKKEKLRIKQLLEKEEKAA